MNIAVNCRLLQKGKLEGIGWFMFENLKRLTQLHPEHDFYFIFDRSFDPDFVFGKNVHPLVVGPATRHPILWYFWLEWRLPRTLKRIQADLFFSPDGYLSLRTKIPQIPVIHDINFAHRPEDLPFWTRHYYNYFFPRFARKATKIITVSSFSKGDIEKTYGIPASKIEVVHNGANEAYEPLSEQEKSTGRDRFAQGFEYFLFIGSIHPRKNLENLIRAYELFKKRTGSAVKLVIVGTKMWKGTGLNDIQSTISNLQSEILFLGRLEAEELKEVLGSALALTFIPWFEGFGIPVLEAMYAGVPVVTSTETSLPEVGGEAVLYAHPADVEQIAQQMEQIYKDNDLRKALISKGLVQKNQYSWDQTAAKVWNCLDTVIHDIKE